MNRKVLAIWFALCGLLHGTSLYSQDWRELLGPGGTARSADAVPTEWNETKNMLWKRELPGDGSSSPIVVGPHVFVTCYSRQTDSFTRYVVCMDKQSGESLWTREFPGDYQEDPYKGYIQEHGYASNTPVSDGKFVYVFFGKGGVHALDMEGQVIWSAEMGKRSSDRQWGSAASLLLVGDRLIVNAADEDRALLALDKTTGKQLWRQESGMLELAYGTPRLVRLSDGTGELVISVPGELWALDPGRGDLNWFATTQLTGVVSPSVVVDGETVYSFGGYESSGSISVRAGGRGDVTDTHVNWTGRINSYVATPLLHEGRFYWIDDRGLAHCINADDGAEVYRQRVSGLTGRPVYASPVLIGGKIYVVTRRAGTIVYSPGDTFMPLARNQIAGDDTDFNASPAVSESRIYLRSNQALYCIGQ